MTVVEAREAQKASRNAEAVFHDKWLEKNKGQVHNKAKGAGGGKTGAPRGNGGAPQAGQTTAKKTNSLFGNIK